ncbi:YfgM family protein [Halomonas daqiaonensis]|uniref:Putative negative regulator of RcsB-dependent stress response n=1 Tax=Halomonas daqiaonensis TaxID=650850 RepID=A0A1H7R0J7_9GAMM|nr:tetratricopeptide repeat protein [Halomonas daqiaonensis]SEL53791.1 Putative negative regulator of RcsB-dependent stress response [Halomonas daqiaonensis]
MAELKTEEEQLEAIKRWWKENGTSLIAGVVIAGAGVFGWNAWQDYQASKAEAASLRYQQLLDLTGRDNLDEQARQRADELVREITAEHGTTLYADLARLLDARLAVDAGDRAQAQAALETVAEGSERDYIAGLARLRLARLQLAEGSAETALTTLEGVPEALAAQRAEVRGNAQHALGRADQAREAWRQALTLADERDQPLYGVQLKLDDLGAEEATL